MIERSGSVIAESNIMPNKYEIDIIDDLAVVSLFYNVIEVEKEDIGIVYEYDYYKIIVPNRDGLEDSINADFEAWVNYAKELENQPKSETDKEKLIRVDKEVVEVKEVIEAIFGSGE